MVAIGANEWAVLVAAVVSMVLGMIWYSKPVFGKVWAKASGMTPKKMEEAKKGMILSFVLGFVATLITAYVLALFLGYLEAATILLGLVTGFLFWLGFIATTLLGMVLWEGKTVRLYIINAGFQLVSMVVMGGIIAGWPRG